MRNVFHTLGQAVIIIAAILLTGLVLFSCKKETAGPSTPRPVLKVLTTYTLWAGQNIEAGTLSVTNDEDNLFITYEITNPDPDLAMDELHLWAGTDIDNCPQNTPGSPKIGQFPYYASPTSSIPTGFPYLTNPLYYSITIPFASMSATCESTIYIAAHAKSGTETLWSEGTLFVWNGPWSTYSTYTPDCGGVK